MSDWFDVTLSDLVQHVDERRGDEKVSTVLKALRRNVESFRKGRCSEAESQQTTPWYKVLQPLDIAYNPLPPVDWCYRAMVGIAGQGYPHPFDETFRTRTEHDARFVGLLLTSGALTPYFDATAIGSIQRRRRTPVSVFLAAPTLVPPLQTSVESSQLCQRSTPTSSRCKRSWLPNGLRGGHCYPDLLPRRRGPDRAFGATALYSRSTIHESSIHRWGLGCIHYAEVHTHFGPIATETRQFLDNDLRTQMRLARPEMSSSPPPARTSQTQAKRRFGLAIQKSRCMTTATSTVTNSTLVSPLISSLQPNFSAKGPICNGTKSHCISGENLGKIKVPIPPMRLKWKSVRS